MNRPNLQKPSFEVFFDGDCPLCRREIEMIRRKDRANVICFTDIADPDFHSEDFSTDQLMREIHGRLPDGEYVKGVEVFRQLYQRIGFRRSVWFSKLPFVRSLLTAMYRIFAPIRYWHAKRRIQKCQSGNCHVDSVTGSITRPREAAPMSSETGS